MCSSHHVQVATVGNLGGPMQARPKAAYAASSRAPYRSHVTSRIGRNVRSITLHINCTKMFHIGNYSKGVVFLIVNARLGMRCATCCLASKHRGHRQGQMRCRNNGEPASDQTPCGIAAPSSTACVGSSSQTCTSPPTRRCTKQAMSSGLLRVFMW